VTPKGSVVLVLSGAADREWAARAVVGLGAAWAAAGQRVVLSDFHIEDPLLDTGSDGGVEGIVDVLLYGVSPARVIRPRSDGTFFIPAGTYVPDPGEIFNHPGLPRLAERLHEGGATLALFAPVEEVDLESLPAWIPEAVLLGSAGTGDAGRVLAARGTRVIESLVPVSVPDAGEGDSSVRPERALPPDEAVPAGVAPTVGTSAVAAGLPPQPVPDLPAVVIPAPAPRAPGPSPRDTPARPPMIDRSDEVSSNELTVLILLIVLTIIVLALFILFNRRSAATAVTPPPAVAEEFTAVPSSLSLPGSEAQFLGYSVSVRAFPTLRAALELVAAEEQRMPETEFYVSPEEIQGVLYYRVLAGISADTISANRLRDELVAAGVVRASDAGGSWSILHSAPLAFDLGHFGSEEEAAARADSLITLGIPAYSTVIPFADGSRRWQLYAGSYRNAASAVWMERALASAGIQTALVPRAGAAVPTVE